LPDNPRRQWQWAPNLSKKLLSFKYGFMSALFHIIFVQHSALSYFMITFCHKQLTKIDFYHLLFGLDLPCHINFFITEISQKGVKTFDWGFTK
jgi:hypothetical protein